MRNNNYWFDWMKAAAIRAARTFAKSALSMITVGMAFSEINWKAVISVSTVASIYSILTSVAGLPEVKEFKEVE